MIKQMLFSCLFLSLIAASGCLAGEVKQGSITGKWITKSDGAMSGAQVLLFNMAAGPPPASDKYLRIPDVTAIIDNDGKFSATVAAGRYYLVMRRHADGSTSGPPQDGDLQYYSRDNKGMARLFYVKAGAETDVGTISEATVFQKQPSKYEKGMTAIAGTVTDEAGIPVEGVRVFVYAKPEMKGKPLYASEGTGADGKYFVNVINKGTYYLKARSHYGGGLPAAGEYMGGYGKQAAPEIVKVNKGELRKGIDIKAKMFPGRKK